MKKSILNAFTNKYVNPDIIYKDFIRQPKILPEK